MRGPEVRAWNLVWILGIQIPYMHIQKSKHEQSSGLVKLWNVARHFVDHWIIPVSEGYSNPVLYGPKYIPIQRSTDSLNLANPSPDAPHHRVGRRAASWPGLLQPYHIPYLSASIRDSFGNNYNNHNRSSNNS